MIVEAVRPKLNPPPGGQPSQEVLNGGGNCDEIMRVKMGTQKS